MSTNVRQLRYREAVAEATCQAMEADERVFVFGVGVSDPKGIFGTTRPAFERFGLARVFDTPVSEAALTGIAIGAALRGLHPLLVHARNDFLMLSMDQIVNNTAKWRYMSGGGSKVPLTIRAIIGRGWGQGPQHSQSLHAMFAHIPGLTVVMPATPHDAKGLLMAALATDGPVMCLEHRWLYERVGPVPEEPYTVPIGRAAIVRPGSDVTIVALSFMVVEALEAAAALAAEGIEAEVIDLRSVRPLDTDTVLASVRKTSRLVVADTGWRSFGASAEVSARVAESALEALKAPIVRVALPDVPTPTSHALERVFYPGATDIAAAVWRTLQGTGRILARPADEYRSAAAGIDASAWDFKGPF